MINNTEEYKSLKQLNTFKFDAKARYFAAPDTPDKIDSLLADAQTNNIPVFILGGGSNVVFVEDFDGLVLSPQIKGIELVDEDEEYTILKVGAGVIWDDFVKYAVERNLGGIENLSAIPGNTGASPVQNIGAYGMEVKDSIISVDGILIDNGARFTLTNDECHFAYRDSIFKNKLKRKTVVTHVIFRLFKNPSYKLDYGTLRQEVNKYGKVSLHNIRTSVIAIRASKLPDPKELGNAGSFFKNPIVEQTKAEQLAEQYPSMPVYPAYSPDNVVGKVKLSAGWLIEQCSLKGYRENNIGVHHKQALVLVNYGDGTASELLSFSQMVQNKVFDRFGIKIEPETILIEN
jgi:UDP-N-acetylmuramate dehydrogenase